MQSRFFKENDGAKSRQLLTSAIFHQRFLKPCIQKNTRVLIQLNICISYMIFQIQQVFSDEISHVMFAKNVSIVEQYCLTPGRLLSIM